MTYQQAIVAGRKWADAIRDQGRIPTKTERDTRMAEIRAAWGDDAAHGFWCGSVD